MSKQEIAIIGGGNMGGALVKGLYKSRHIFVCETNAIRARYLKKKYDVTIAPLKEAIAQAEVVIFAVKPQDIEKVLKEVGPCAGKLFISIAAGLTTKFFEQHLGGKAKVIRAMPNMPASISAGTAGICVGTYAKPADLITARTVLSTTSTTIIEVKENMMDAVTAVSGSGPAYVFLFVEQWVAAAKALGLKEKEAKELVHTTLLGSIKLLEQNKFDVEGLRAKVTSKGGTTQAAMDAFVTGHFNGLMKKAILAAKNRSKELAR